MSASKQPLRAALIGLSSTAATSWAAKAHLPGLLTETGRSKYTITALLNSSTQAAHSAIKTNNLPSTTKAYGDPEELAQDPDIDVVICNVRVDKHYETILPSIRAGKDVFVEWPIAHDLKHIDELVEAKRKSGSRVAVGLQRRWLPQVLKLKDILKEGKVGKILSADVKAFGGRNHRSVLPASLKYFTEKHVGGNVITIGVGHALDFVLSVLGELDPGSVASRVQNQRPDVSIKDLATGKVVETTRSDVPDLLTVQGALTPSAQVVSNASFSFSFRAGQQFPNTPAFTFSINCEFAEIRLVSPASLALEFSPPDQLPTIQIHWFETDTLEEVEWSSPEDQLELEPTPRGVAQTLYAFADGKEAGNGWVEIEDARARAVLLDGFLSGPGSE